MKISTRIAFVCAIALSLAACVSKSQFEEQKTLADSLRKQLADGAKQTSEMQVKNTDLQKQIDELNTTLEAVSAKLTAKVTSPPSTTPQELFYNINEETRLELHKLAGRCAAMAVKIPQAQKIKWCQENLGNSLAIAQKQQMSALLKSQLNACKDDKCREDLQASIKQWETLDANKETELKKDLGQCSAKAQRMLIDRCLRIEASSESIAHSLKD